MSYFLNWTFSVYCACKVLLPKYWNRQRPPFQIRKITLQKPHSSYILSRMHISVLPAVFFTCDFQFITQKRYSRTSSSRQCSGIWFRLGGHFFETKLFWSTVTKFPCILPFWSGVHCIVTCLLIKILTSARPTGPVTDVTVYLVSHLLFVISRELEVFCKWQYIKKHAESYWSYINSNEFINWLFPHWQNNVSCYCTSWIFFRLDDIFNDKINSVLKFMFLPLSVKFDTVLS